MTLPNARMIQTGARPAARTNTSRTRCFNSFASGKRPSAFRDQTWRRGARGRAATGGVESVHEVDGWVDEVDGWFDPDPECIDPCGDLDWLRLHTPE